MEFEFHFYQKYGTLLDKMKFEEQIEHRWKLLQELKNATALSDILDTQAKYMIAQRNVTRENKKGKGKIPIIISSAKHNPDMLDSEKSYIPTQSIYNR